ncbi:hypothetical protein A9Q84_18445 [Halobacteriovorax marinus]|uniref:Class II aldolase/adducin N-terminal domain-containing protein n=1 Tax=Halobacteriovorax marinus TaxID=97084 RepID=A0A1Y5F222_9BACT|nr:hypothetical protein A9Q84_18445 [Halobacteriovorax marinus]
MIDDGVIKYDRSNFSHSGPLNKDSWGDLEQWREKLYQLNLIGEYLPEKVGFGNLSKLLTREKGIQFVITGTQTGKFKNLTGDHYSQVEGYDLEHMKLFSRGPLEPSSEALTHAAVYESVSTISAVFHIHSTKIWKEMIDNNYDATPEDVPYGTLEMATCVQELIAKKESGTIVMKGHQDGVIAYATTLDECGKLILDLAKKFL